MLGWIFGWKKGVKKLEDDVKSGFDLVKKDINSLSEWVKHLNSKHSGHESEFKDLKERLSSIEESVEEIQSVVSLFNDQLNKRAFKTTKQVFDKQTPVGAVQTGVQTPVQTGVFANFSVMERAIIYILLNTDMKLSYDDLAAMLGKDRSTVRGHINRIKQKSEDLVCEVIEKNGKKRLFIPEEIREKMLKKAKVRVRNRGKSRKKV